MRTSPRNCRPKRSIARSRWIITCETSIRSSIAWELLRSRKLLGEVADDREFEILALKRLDQAHDPRDQKSDGVDDPDQRHEQTQERAQKTGKLRADEH